MSARKGKGRGQIWEQHDWSGAQDDRASLCHKSRQNGPAWDFLTPPLERTIDGCRPPAPILDGGTAMGSRFRLNGYPTFTHGRSGGFEPVAGVAVAFIVTGKVDAKAAFAA